MVTEETLASAASRTPGAWWRSWRWGAGSRLGYAVSGQRRVACPSALQAEGVGGR
jgi:hypothetical protein